jgi:hypothetical protein
MVCVGQGQTCPSTAGAVCNGKSCGTCGAQGSACCADPVFDHLFCAQPRSTCHWVGDRSAGVTRCDACGAVGEPCCFPLVGAVGVNGSCETGLQCSGDYSSSVCLKPQP